MGYYQNIQKYVMSVPDLVNSMQFCRKVLNGDKLEERMAK